MSPLSFRSPRRCYFALCLLASLLSPLTHSPAQTATPLLLPDKVPFDFYERGPYRPEVPRPATLLGYEPGSSTRPTRTTSGSCANSPPKPTGCAS